MNQKIKNHVIAYSLKMGWPCSTDKEVIDVIHDHDEVWCGDELKRRHWTDCTTVVEIDGMFIGYSNAHGAGDNHPSDVGWEFDPESIFEAEPKIITTTVHVKKKQ